MYNSAEHYAATYRAFEPEFAFNAESRGELETWQEGFRPRLRQILGLDNLAVDLEGHQPTAELRSTEDMGEYLRESWHIYVEPTMPLPFFLMRPKTESGVLPLVLTPHGHNRPARADAGQRHGRLRIIDAQTVSFALKTPWSDGTTHVLLSPRGDDLSRLRRPHEAHCSADGAVFHPQLRRRGGVAVTGSTDRPRKTACPTRIRLRELTIVRVRQAKYVLLCGSRTAGTVPAELTTRPWG